MRVLLAFPRQCLSNVAEGFFPRAYAWRYKVDSALRLVIGAVGTCLESLTISDDDLAPRQSDNSRDAFPRRRHTIRFQLCLPSSRSKWVGHRTRKFGLQLIALALGNPVFTYASHARGVFNCEGVTQVGCGDTFLAFGPS